MLSFDDIVPFHVRRFEEIPQIILEYCSVHVIKEFQRIIMPLFAQGNKEFCPHNTLSGGQYLHILHSPFTLFLIMRKYISEYGQNYYFLIGI